jgi:hypothetical protein
MAALASTGRRTLLPDEFAPQVDEMMTAGIEVVKRTLEAPTHAA